MKTTPARSFLFVFALWFVAVLAIAHNGCGTILNSTNPTFTFISPSGPAQLHIDGQSYGSTPVTLSLDNTVDHEFVAECASGDVDTRYIVSRVNAGLAVASFLVAGLIGLIVDASTGEWRDLDLDERRPVNVCVGRSESSEVPLIITEPVEDVPAAPERERRGGRLE